MSVSWFIMLVIKQLEEKFGYDQALSMDDKTLLQMDTPTMNYT